MSRTAYVRMRGEEWDISISDAVRLEQAGAIWRDYDCEQNTRDNGNLDAGPCFGVTGDEDGPEERRNAEAVQAAADMREQRVAAAHGLTVGAYRRTHGIPPWGVTR